MSETMDIGQEDVTTVSSDVTPIETTCGTCQHPATFNIPKAHTEPFVVFEPPCGHKNAHPNPHYRPGTPEASPDDDGTEHVSMTDAGTATDAAG